MKLRKSLAILLTVAMLATCVVSVLPVAADGGDYTTAALTTSNKITAKNNILAKATYTGSIATPTYNSADVLVDGR